MSETGEKLLYKLNKSLYGLKQSGRNWYKSLHDYLEQNNFVRNASDQCIYRKQSGTEIIVVIIWVEDLIIAASNQHLLNKFKNSMKSQFYMKDLGKIYFWDIQFEQKGEEIKMNHRKYILRILENLVINSVVDHKEYREIVGSLIYAMYQTRHWLDC